MFEFLADADNVWPSGLALGLRVGYHSVVGCLQAGFPV